jgi:hypothetical protein
LLKTVLLRPIIELKRDNERGRRRGWSAVHSRVQILVGPGHPGAKLMAIAAAGVLLFGGVATGTYRISAKPGAHSRAGGRAPEIIAPLLRGRYWREPLDSEFHQLIWNPRKSELTLLADRHARLEPTRRRALRSEFTDEEWRPVSELADHPNRLLVTATPEGGETYVEVRPFDCVPSSPCRPAGREQSAFAPRKVDPSFCGCFSK